MGFYGMFDGLAHSVAVFFTGAWIAATIAFVGGIVWGVREYIEERKLWLLGVACLSLIMLFISCSLVYLVYRK